MSDTGTLVFKEALNAYNVDIELAVKRRDSTSLCRLLRFPDERTIMAITEFYRSGRPLPRTLHAPWHHLPNLVCANFLSTGAVSVHNWVEASRQLNHALRIFLDTLSSDTSWSIPLLVRLCEDARVIAREADRQLVKGSLKPRFIDEVTHLLQRALSIVRDDRRSEADGSKTLATLTVLNQLLKIYFYANDFNPCLSIADSVRNNELAFQNFPIEQRVVFKFYEGRLAFYNNHYSEAIEAFSFAMAHIPPSDIVQRRRVLLFMIPAKIMTGSLPSNNTLQVFQMHWFQPIVQSIRSGDIGMFDSTLRKNTAFFIRSGIYLTVQKMVRLVYRALIRKLMVMVGSNRIMLQYVIAGFKAAETSTDLPQVTCTLDNLIHQGIIDGYIAPKLGVLVIRDFVNPADGSRTATKSLLPRPVDTN